MKKYVPLSTRKAQEAHKWAEENDEIAINPSCPRTALASAYLGALSALGTFDLEFISDFVGIDDAIRLNDAIFRYRDELGRAVLKLKKRETTT